MAPTSTTATSKDLIVAMMMNALLVPERAIAKQRRTQRAS